MRLLLLASLLLATPALAEELVAVPFVGCKTEGQGEGAVPASADQLPRLPAVQAARLAYYGLVSGNGVLAPRGWDCWGFTADTGGSTIVLPQPLDPKKFWSGKLSIKGPFVIQSYTFGGTYGRFQVMDRGSRFFPEHPGLKRLRQTNFELFDDRAETPGAKPPPAPKPYPEKYLTRFSDTELSYRTAPGKAGIGTGGMIKPGVDAVIGAVRIDLYPGYDEIDLVDVSVRLSPDLADLTPVILGQVVPALSAAQKPE